MDSFESGGQTGTASTASSLIAAAKTQQPEAWDRLARLYGPMVYGFARSFALQQSDAADVAQEVFASVRTGLARFEHRKPEDRFRAWLYTITRNQVRLHVRRRDRAAQAVGGTEAHQAMQQIPDSLAEYSTSYSGDGEAPFLRRAMEIIRAEFEPNVWSAFLAFTLHDRTAADVGDELGMSADAVRQAKCRVLRRLKEFLADD
ncbi:MAG: sigma-70 family RNA polymerase sigma factor [Thermoguttaceae bacterium]|jgi:RNA polymerase sigma-70 factor (ECF subfamily)|nr:sigma-70 family RNA polymerase sigma factor [Thermoguttaceae bacterium]